MKLQRQNRDHMERALDFECLIALRCESARRQSRSKIFKVKKIFNFFQNGFSHVSGLWDNLKRKKIRISDQSESRYRNEIAKAETPRFLGTVYWGRTSLGQYSWGRTSWGRRSVGQQVLGKEVGNPNLQFESTFFSIQTFENFH